MLLIVQRTNAHGRGRERWPANKLQLSKKQWKPIQQTKDGSVEIISEQLVSLSVS